MSIKKSCKANVWNQANVLYIQRHDEIDMCIWTEKKHSTFQIKMNVKWCFLTFERCALCICFFSMAPSEGENELLSQKRLSFQKVKFEKRISLWVFSRKDTLASSLTRSSIYPHRRWVDLSIIIRTLKKTSIKKRSWSSKIMLN